MEAKRARKSMNNNCMKDNCMTKEPMFYLCEKCGNVILKVRDSGMKPYCCGSVMTLLVPETREGELGDKHLPVIKREGNELHIQVGSTMHPHTEDHYIEWVCVYTNCGSTFVYPSKKNDPVVTVTLKDGEEVEGVYVFCNIHGLWKGLVH